MHDDDVSLGDMNPHEFTDDEAETMISGAVSGDPHLGASLDEIRSAFDAIDPPIVSAALSEFVGAGTSGSEGTGAAVPPVVAFDVGPDTPRRNPVLTSVSAFAGTAIGKICIGASVAAASVGGAAATGAINTPFDDNSVVETEFVEDSELDLELADLDGSDDSNDSNSSDDSNDSNDSNSSDDSNDSNDSTTTIPNSGGFASVSHTVDGVGTVAFTYDNGTWTLTNVSPAAGWAISESGIDAEGPDVSFEMGNLEVDVDVEVENGQIRVRVRTENDETDEESEVFSWYAIS